MNEYVWYASYGSNLSKERFYKYIFGGKAIGALTSEEGSKIKQEPVESKKISIPFELLFVEQSTRWQKQGVAVIGDYNPTVNTLGRMYLIEKDQFFDIVKQENALSIHDPVNISLPKNRYESLILFRDKRYGKILHLGDESGYPIYTFTTPKNLEDLFINKPSKEYLKIIASGLLEIYTLSTCDLIVYFITKKGVNGHYTKANLKEVFE